MTRKIIYVSGSAAEAIEHIHDIAMARGTPPEQACSARLNKALAGVLESWIADERARGTNPLHMIHASHDAAMSLLSAAILNTCRPDAWSQVMRETQPVIDRLLQATAAGMAEYGQQVAAERAAQAGR